MSAPRILAIVSNRRPATPVPELGRFGIGIGASVVQPQRVVVTAGELSPASRLVACYRF